MLIMLYCFNTNHNSITLIYKGIIICYLVLFTKGNNLVVCKYRKVRRYLKEQW